MFGHSKSIENEQTREVATAEPVRAIGLTRNLEGSVAHWATIILWRPLHHCLKSWFFLSLLSRVRRSFNLVLMWFLCIPKWTAHVSIFSFSFPLSYQNQWQKGKTYWSMQLDIETAISSRNPSVFNYELIFSYFQLLLSVVFSILLAI